VIIVRDGNRHRVSLHNVAATEHITWLNGEKLVSARLRSAHHGDGRILVRLEFLDGVEVKRYFHDMEDSDYLR
jgi:hypothetical protein